MLAKLKQIIAWMNERGIPAPLLRDHGRPSVSFTLLVLSSLFVMLGLVSLTVPGLQVNFWEALAWHITSAVLYYNRGAKISKDGLEIEAPKDSNGKEGSDSGRTSGANKGSV